MAHSIEVPLSQLSPVRPVAAAHVSHGDDISGEVAFIALFLASAALGTVLGDQPGVTLFCWAVGLAAAGTLCTRTLRRGGAQRIVTLDGHPRRWGLRPRP